MGGGSHVIQTLPRDSISHSHTSHGEGGSLFMFVIITETVLSSCHLADRSSVTSSRSTMGCPYLCVSAVLMIICISVRNMETLKYLHGAKQNTKIISMHTL